MLSFWVEANLCRFLNYLFISVFLCHWRSNYQEGWVGIPLTSLTLPHFCACSKPGPPVFQCHMAGSSWCSMVWCERWLFSLLVLVDCWPSLFKFSFHNIVVWLCLRFTFADNNWISNLILFSMANFQIVFGKIKNLRALTKDAKIVIFFKFFLLYM